MDSFQVCNGCENYPKAFDRSIIPIAILRRKTCKSGWATMNHGDSVSLRHFSKDLNAQRHIDIENKEG